MGRWWADVVQGVEAPRRDEKGLEALLAEASFSFSELSVIPMRKS
jgi:hypothetical protein